MHNETKTVMTSIAQADAAGVHPHHRHGWWWKTLIAGLLLWAVTVVVTGVTLNSNLIPTLILIGSFLVPFCVVLFVVERVSGNVSVLQVILAFFVGGMSGVLGASLLEANLTANFWTYIMVGLIEEFVKASILVIVGWRVVPKTARQGALLGATIGAGFAAFESAGYAFNAAITAQGIDLTSLLQTEMLRAILAPVGHVLWTAIIGAAIFGVARGGDRFRWSFLILAAYVGVAILHALWDSMGGISSFLALVFTGNALQQLQYGFLMPRTAQAASNLATTLYIVGLALAAVLGILALWITLGRPTRRSVAARRAAAVAGPPE
ncbi:MAG: protease PrsW [Microbacteriaceae bacterium]|jgi:RsiW-degrading membrane proteinase PrsW (M82 family)|nr:protease PrsW [Microbacteriaceae bacterium]